MMAANIDCARDGSHRVCTIPRASRARSSAAPIYGRGYTLIELMVVIALLSIVMFFSIPRFQGTMAADDIKKTARWIIIKAKTQKQKAVQTQQQTSLFIDLDANKLWTADASMSEEALTAAAEQGYQLSESLTIRDVTFPNGEQVAGGQTRIQFHKEGYSDKALIHLEDIDGRRLSLIIEPFLPTIKVVDDYVEFD